MCRFASAIFLRNGDMIADFANTDSHAELAEAFGLARSEMQAIRHEFVRVELVPSENWADVSSYRFILDEEHAPDWADSDFLAKAERTIRAAVNRMIVRDSRQLLLGGCWILAESVKIASTKNARIVQMLGSSSVNQMLGSSRVDLMLGSSSVNQMLGSSRVDLMRDSSRVDLMRDSSSVNQMLDSSRVDLMRDSSSVKEMWGSSSVNQMRGSSRVKEMRDSSTAPRRP